jgi:hypothetical protein
VGIVTPEGKVKKKVKALLEKYEIYYYMPVPGGYGRVGVGDFICCVNGKFLAIETKADDNVETVLQEEDGKKVRKSKGLKLTIRENDMQYLEITLKRLLES